MQEPIETTHAELEERLRFETLLAGETVTIARIIVRTAMADSATVKASVTDFGTGIDEKNIERLFESLTIQIMVLIQTLFGRGFYI
jgi:signal transduction histidine kinase